MSSSSNLSISSSSVSSSESSRLAYFEIVIALGPQGEFGLRDSMPWGKVKEDLQHFSAITSGSEKVGIFNAVIMGRKTFETLKYNPLPNRLNVVISKTLTPPGKNDGNQSHLVFASLDAALKFLAKLQDEKQVGKVFVIGGVNLVLESLSHPSCEALHVTNIIPIAWKFDYDSILWDWNYNSELHISTGGNYREKTAFENYQEIDERKTIVTENNRKQKVELQFFHFVRIRSQHPENAFLELLQRIKRHGTAKSNRTSISTLRLWGEQVRFDLRAFPLITTKRVFFRGVVEELLFFLSGKTQSRVLEEKGINVWKANTRREFLDKRGLTHYEEGELGKSYPLQWRHFGAECRANEQLELGQGGIDQIRNVIENIQKVKLDPNHESARRLLVTAWNPTNIKDMALPCCHDSFQFQVEDSRLNCLFRMRSSDVAVGLPWNIAFYALLTYMIGNIVDLQPGILVASLSDAHIYTNCLEQINEQLARSPRAWPKLKIVGTYKSIDDFHSDSFKLVDYYPHSSIKMEMAV
jgi:dihydrofolate reductase / thymidylate synthase